ncbi:MULTISPECIES: hypothetical protein [Olivibacter]|uniref:Ferritin-like metal-binding protein YciE n=2 Tax=Olivibacter TaxID=376469 RepID=A0ABV6HKG7_9SPHI|nr:hypothetical protein [Olivibacter jilunii]MDX3913154.1 hypothetical protein [Pseudosphingobacterium sp.]
MKDLLYDIVADDCAHAKFLNTLSLMENSGACKISAIKDNALLNLTLLKHAAEEHRHAYHLKRQSRKLGTYCNTYQTHELLAPIVSKQYLDRLNLDVYRYFKDVLAVSPDRLRFYAYLMVTYIIELRADELYPLYQEVLLRHGSKVNVKAIIQEEKGHLEEMVNQLTEYDGEWRQHASYLIIKERRIFSDWINRIKQDLYESDGSVHA